MNNILVITSVLFGVIDILGAIPLLDSLKEKRNGVPLNSTKISLFSLGIMILFLFFGELILKSIGLGIPEFAVAGSIIILVMAVEMIFGIEVIKAKDDIVSDIVPAVFPIIAGTGTLSTIMSLSAQYSNFEIIVGIFLNMILVFITIQNLEWIKNKIGAYGMVTLRNIMGVILLAISLKMMITNLKILF
ncbi:MarC family protein [bacterium]|nr:MarC family protein [bacterium]